MEGYRHRSVAFAPHEVADQGETEPLLHDLRQADADGYFPPQWSNTTGFTVDQHGHLPVYDTIHQ